jgi:hypothetical protein
LNYALRPESYISEDGNYGTSMLLTFEYNSLTEEQHELVSILPDRDKMSYALAILKGQEDLSEWEG